MRAVPDDAYGLNRPTIAAVAVYSAPAPYELALDLCSQTPITGPPANSTELELYNPRVPTDAIIDHEQHGAASCDSTCGTDKNGDLLNPQAASRGAMNHLHWPDQWTAAMLAFFRGHPLHGQR